MTDRDVASVLLVDDQPAKLLTYEAILGELDLRLVSANSAREALDHLLRGDYAVVLVDVCMPDLDGFELAAMIREHPRFKRTAVIFVSGVHLSDLDRMRGYAAGAVDYVPVPVIPEILRAKVSAFVELYHTTRQLERLNAELEQRVVERTAELEEANHRKDEFLAVLAHELRNPLAAIRAASHLLSTSAEVPAVREKTTGIIQRQVGLLVRLIDDLVDMSRISRGIISLQRARVEVPAVVAHTVEANRAALEARQHELIVEVPDECPSVLGDAARLSQVIGNLLANAAKFTEPGGRVHLRVETEPGHLTIRVKDTGIGIEPEMLSRIFELFTQIEGPGHQSSTGLGIGLALVRRIVELHEGQVWAYSEGRGTGTEVVVRLPTAPALEAIVPASTPASAPVTQRRVMIVDDNADAADAMAMLLRSAGHDVESANDGAAAIERGGTFTPEVILLDLGMPRMDGYETARRIRQCAWGKSTAIVALTGWGQARDRTRTRDAGFDAHLVKPVDETTLLALLQELPPS